MTDTIQSVVDKWKAEEKFSSLEKLMCIKGTKFVANENKPVIICGVSRSELLRMSK
jgi:hypothetical protein